MAGTLEGGKRAAATNKARHGDAFYGRIGAIGGRAKVSKGFAVRRDLAREAGRKGGTISRRTRGSDVR